jgi:hypothetical protein
VTVLAFTPRHVAARPILDVAREVFGSSVSEHWLIFNDAREILGCHCGFDADEGDCGYGDSVVTHLLEQGPP